MKQIKRLLASLVALLLVLGVMPVSAEVESKMEHQSTILFTHDMHSHFLPVPSGNGGESGGFARLATLVREQKERYPDALLVDAGDFSMGSLFQSIYATEAPELRIMGMMGYDATTFGNHEYDFRPAGLTAMLYSAVNSGDPVPPIVESNYYPAQPDDPDFTESDQAVRDAFDRYGVKDYLLLERGGITYGIFGIMGAEADSNAPESEMKRQEAVVRAQEIINQMRSEVGKDQPLFTICLSHSGTFDHPKKSEDEILAKEVDGLDVIISGHTHSVLEEPIRINDTIIVSAGCYTANLGVLDLAWNEDGTKQITRYDLLPVNESVMDDPKVAAKVDLFKGKVVEDYLGAYGFDSFDQIIGHNNVVFSDVNQIYEEHREHGLGDLIADSYLHAIREVDPENDIPTVALTATGVIRETIVPGDISVSDVFNVASLGVGLDGMAGYPLASVYVTGKELKAICEVDASVTPLMAPAQLHVSGMAFDWNNHRMIFNKVSNVYLVNEDGTRVEVQDDQLYRVVAGLYCVQMLSAVKEQSFGILSIVPKDINGNEITDFDDCIVYDKHGNEAKEWYALASYIQRLPGGEIPQQYDMEHAVERKVESHSWNPVALLKGANGITIGVLCFGLALILIVVLVVRGLILRHRFKRRYGKGQSYQGHRNTRHKRVSKRKYGSFEYHGEFRKK